MVAKKFVPSHLYIHPLTAPSHQHSPPRPRRRSQIRVVAAAAVSLPLSISVSRRDVMALPLPRAPCLLLLLVVVVAAAQSPISQPPSPLLRHDADSDNDNGSAASPVPASSPPAPTDPSPAEAPSFAHSAATSPPAPAGDKEGDADDYNKKKKEKAPAAMEVKAGSGSAEEQPQKAKRRGGRKAGVFHYRYKHANTWREAHVEPADKAGYRTYIVLLEPPAGHQHMDADAHRAWHQSFLPSLKTALGKPRLRRSYRTLVHGFSALLTEAEVKRVSAKPGFVRAFPNVIRYLQTTRTPAFLGLSYQGEESPQDWPGYGGLGMIIGIIDGGIANSHPSMDDAGFDSIEPPQRWRGSCDKDIKCNRKLIGAKNCFNSGPPLDVDQGHGTHVASIAAGNFVADANVNGLASGNASGIAPRAHVAVYKACGRTGCPDESLLSAIIAAVDDGVHVISLSVGGTSTPTYDHDPIAVASFVAMRAGVLVVATAGNDGPRPSTVHNDIPWLMTVGAGTVDRSLMARVVIGNNVHNPLHVLDGQSLADRQWLTTVRPDALHDLLFSEEGSRADCVYPEDERAKLVPGRIVICQAGGEMREENLDELLSSNASAIVMVDPKEFGYTGSLVDTGNRPVMQVAYKDGESLKGYSSSSSRILKAAINFTRGTVLGTTPAPTVAYFSSRGPSRYFPAILKPDVLAPGVNILGGIPYQVRDGPVYFGFDSGTSMAVPHVSGAAILLKSMHPSWSPAAIRSALMTTADIVDNTGHGIQDEQLDAANAYQMGAGHINVSSAMDPGLVYELNEGQYAAHVCSTLGEAALRAVSRNNSWRCSEQSATHPSNLNYPSITVPLRPRGFVVVRALKNVAPLSSEPEKYTIKVVMPPEVHVTVDPSSITFNYTGEEAWYQIFLRSTSNAPAQGAVYHGSVEWSSSKHTVRSPMLAVVDLATSQPSTPWNLD